MSTQKFETLSGVIDRVTFHNPETGFCVLQIRIQGKKDLVTTIGTSLSAHPGEHIDAQGTWINDKNFGMQFKAEQFKIVAPTTIEGIERYLGSGLLKGIGPHFARKLVAAFGLEVFAVLNQNPQRLKEVPGFGSHRQAKVIASWEAQKDIHDIVVFLQTHGLGINRAVRIYKTYGSKAITRVKENPYQLALDIPGIGFQTADQLAMNLGIPPHSVLRAEAGLRHILKTTSSQGHCAMAFEEVANQTQTLLDIPEPVVHLAIQNEIAAQNIICEGIYGKPYLFLSHLYWAEMGIVKELRRLMSFPNSLVGEGNLDESLKTAQAELGIVLSPTQIEAVRMALHNKLVIITGGPGVGKTTIMKTVLQLIKKSHPRLCLAAPTGRAAKRLADASQMEAKTLHRLLEYDAQTHQFRRSSNYPLPADWVILDECSMIDVTLFYQFLKAIPDNAGLALVGDIDQLPSVGPGSVLADLIQSNVLPVAKLTEIHRQATTSQIIVNAHRINKGLMPEPPAPEALNDFYFIKAKTPEEIRNKLIEVVTRRIPARFGFQPIQDIQVLVPMNKGSIGVHALNRDLQSVLNKHPPQSLERRGHCFGTGDKVIQLVNNYDKEVFNGDIGTIKGINTQDKVMLLLFDNRLVSYDFDELDELALAYATTIHKSQGSEYPAVVIPITTQHYNLLERNLIYTAVTRGRKLVVIVGQAQALNLAIKTQKMASRITFLDKRLKGE